MGVIAESEWRGGEQKKLEFCKVDIMPSVRVRECLARQMQSISDSDSDWTSYILILILLLLIIMIILIILLTSVFC